VCAQCDQYKSYSGNALVISSMCLLLLFFVVGLTLSHYWDVVQRRRYNSVLLCGLDGPFRYQLLIVTGKLPGAGDSFALFDVCQQLSVFTSYRSCIHSFVHSIIQSIVHQPILVHTEVELYRKW